MRGLGVLISIGCGALLVLVLAPFIGAHAASEKIFWDLRVPRVGMAFLAGAGLAASGLAFQAFFRNPLATPFTLGVSSGAALGAASSVRLGLTFSLLGIPSTSLAALAGALAAILLVYGLTSARGGFSIATMLLAGVAASFFFSSVMLFIQYTSDFYDSFRILRWLMGGLAEAGFDDLLAAVPFIACGGGILACLTHELNLLTLGEELATSRGVDVRRARRFIFASTSLMVGGIVAICGPIGFVGMMAPHMCRLMIGPDHRHLLPASVLFGGGFLVVCDTVARTILAPAELPVGILTAFLGGPFFLWLLLRGVGERR